MVLNNPIFIRLESVSDESVDLALAAAMPTADPATLSDLVALALKRGHLEAQAAVIEAFDRLPPASRDQVISQTRTLAAPMRRTLGRSSAQGALNVVALIRAARAAELAYLVAEPLRIGPAPLRQAAAQCLLELAQTTLTPDDGQLSCPPRLAQQVQAVVEEVVTRFRFHQTDVSLTALLALARRPLPQAAPYLDKPTSPGVAALRKMLTRGEDAFSRRALIPMLGRPSLAPSAIAGLRNIATGPHAIDALALVHLLLAGHISRRLRQATGMDQLLVSAPHGADASSRRRWIVWTASVAKGQALAERLARMSRDDDAHVRLTALRKLIASRDGHTHSDTVIDAAIDAAIGRFCMDREAAIARIALRFLHLVRWPGLERMLARLVRSDDVLLREVARRAMGEQGFDGLWRNWNTLASAARRAAGRALMRLDDTFELRLRGQLRKTDTDTQVRAICILRELGLAPRFGPELVTRTTAKDAKVASAAARALGACKSDGAAHLRRLLDHPDPRVRANAAQGLGELRSAEHHAPKPWTQHLLAMAEKEQPRPRAQAIGTLLGDHHPQALEALSSMLSDPRPAQRRSALWLIESAGLIDLNAHIAETAVSDQDTDIRKRAARTLRSLLSRMRRSDEPAPCSV